MRDQDGLYFATSGIRGKSNLEISPELALRVGRAVANWLIDDKNSSHNVYVGFDNRRNSISIANVIIAALTSSGINVTTFSDPIPTPLLIFSILNSKSDAGIMVTGSHLPKDDNGIILFDETGNYFKGILEEPPSSIVPWSELGVVNYNQEQDADRKIELFHQVMKEKDKKGMSHLEQEQFNFLSQWHYVAIYVLVDMEEFSSDPEWITSKLRKKITTSNVEKAINDLIKIRLLEFDTEKGLRQTKGALDTTDEIMNMAVIPYHRNMINLALNYLEEGDWSLREFNGGTLPMNPKTLDILKTKIREFRREVNEMTDNLDNVSDVYQFNLQLFPLTESKV
ncbi:TIGR02147 family protein [archaeon]|nr:TIGR02147 family protein [archaeon]